MTEYLELVLLFFLQGAAIGMWFVPLSRILDAHGLEQIRSFAFASSAIAAFVSPLIFGAMADRHASPVVVLRGLAFATAILMLSVGFAIKHHLNPWIVLALIQLLAFCSTPSWSITATIVFARLANSQREFGPIRAMATLGWMVGCWFISALGADASTMAMFAAAGVWLAVGIFTFFVPQVATPKGVQQLTLSQRFGLDALTLLKVRDHRVVFIMLVLFSIPVAAFYPFAPVHLREIGLRQTSAWMTLGQVSEVLAMLSVGLLLDKMRLKWVFTLGLAFGVTRFALSALNSPTWLLLGVALHGASYTLVFITAQIYIDQRVDKAWRARGQALMSLVTGGFGNLLGYLGTGRWFRICENNAHTNWPVFWGGLSALSLVILIFFLTAYRGIKARPSAS